MGLLRLLAEVLLLLVRWLLGRAAAREEERAPQEVEELQGALTEGDEAKVQAMFQEWRTRGATKEDET